MTEYIEKIQAVRYYKCAHCGNVSNPYIQDEDIEPPSWGRWYDLGNYCGRLFGIDKTNYFPEDIHKKEDDLEKLKQLEIVEKLKQLEIGHWVCVECNYDLWPYPCFGCLRETIFKASPLIPDLNKIVLEYVMDPLDNDDYECW